MRFEWFKYKSSGDIISISSCVIPISSQVSLIQAVCGSSPFSILPPGKAISFGWLLSVLDLTSNNIS